jgi:hypothetical protein
MDAGLIEETSAGMVPMGLIMDSRLLRSGEGVLRKLLLSCSSGFNEVAGLPSDLRRLARPLRFATRLESALWLFDHCLCAIEEGDGEPSPAIYPVKAVCAVFVAFIRAPNLIGLLPGEALELYLIAFV